MISMSIKRSRNLRNWKGRLDLPQETRELVFLYDMVQHKSNLEHTYSVHAWIYLECKILSEAQMRANQIFDQCTSNSLADPLRLNL